jgi:hypothetical protein
VPFSVFTSAYRRHLVVNAPPAAVDTMTPAPFATSVGTVRVTTQLSAAAAYATGWVPPEGERHGKRLRTIGPDVPVSTLPLIHAVTQAISSLPSDEMKTRFAENIIFVGGSSKIRGLVEYFEDQLINHLPVVEPVVQQVEVLSVPKIRSTDPALLSWKGASVLFAVCIFYLF